MILHLATDEKFIDHVITMFETVAPNENHFIIDSRKDKSQIKYINQKDKIKIIDLSSKENFSDFCSTLHEYEFIVLHCLFYNALRIIPHASSNQKIVWGLFGLEIYGLYEFQDIFEESMSLFRKFINRVLFQIKEFMIFSYYLFIKHGISRPRLFRQVCHRINYILSTSDGEFTLIKKRLRTLNCEQIKWCYFAIDDVEVTQPSGDNILIGNSATSTNNHIQILRTLADIDLEYKKIIIPLNYGSNIYRRKIIKYVKNNFKHYYCLQEFLPLHKYKKIINSCSIVIMGHYRQQALGNIILALSQGCKIFLYERNSLYYFLKNLELHIFSIEKDLTPQNQLVLLPLTSEQQRHNCNIMQQNFSKKSVIKKTATLIEIVRRDIAIYKRPHE